MRLPDSQQAHFAPETIRTSESSVVLRKYSFKRKPGDFGHSARWRFYQGKSALVEDTERHRLVSGWLTPQFEAFEVAHDQLLRFVDRGGVVHVNPWRGVRES